MLDIGVPEEIHSAWSSHIVIVQKPDGSLRFCNDFSKLNEISRFDAYPMPRLTTSRSNILGEHLRSVSGASLGGPRGPCHVQVHD
jgi:hypothetical protein